MELIKNTNNIDDNTSTIVIENAYTNYIRWAVFELACSRTKGHGDYYHSTDDDSALKDYVEKFGDAEKAIRQIAKDFVEYAETGTFNDQIQEYLELVNKRKNFIMKELNTYDEDNNSLHEGCENYYGHVGSDTSLTDINHEISEIKRELFWEFVEFVGLNEMDNLGGSQDAFEEKFFQLFNPVDN